MSSRPAQQIIVVLVVLSVGVCCSDRLTAQTKKPQISSIAAEVHENALLFDGHNDLPWQIRNLAGGSLEKLDISKEQPELHTDLPKLKRSGLDAQFWSVYVSSDTIDTNDSLFRTMEQIAIVQRMIEQYPETFEMASTADDVERIASEGKIASMMGVEGGHSIEGSIQALSRFYDVGVRYMTLTHNRSLDWATSCSDKDATKGLSPFGEEIVREMNRIGMLVDLSHVSDQTMRDAIRVSQAPVIFSHSSVRAICDHPRNVPDEILELLPENGGVIMINFMSGYVVPTAELEKDKSARGTLGTVIDHIDHVVKVAGIDHVGIGSDYDGVSTLPVGLEDVTTYPDITQELLDRGYTESDIHKILGGNTLRVLRKAEAVSHSLKRDGE